MQGLIKNYEEKLKVAKDKLAKFQGDSKAGTYEYEMRLRADIEVKMLEMIIEDLEEWEV